MMSKIFANSGVGSHIMDLSKGLIAQGHTVSIMSSTNDHPDFCQKEGVDFCKVDFSMNPVKFIKNYTHIFKHIRKNDIDVVHCHHRTCSFYMHFLSKLVGVPFVWSNHLDNIPSDFIHRITTFHGHKSICVSTDLKQFCMNKLRIPEKDIEVVLNGITPSEYYFDENYVNEFKQKHGIEGKKVIGLFARMAPIKGHDCLIEALSKMDKEKLNETVTVFFGGTEGEYADYLREQISQRGLDGYVLFEGFVSPSQALSLSDITVLPSLKEGFGIVTVESFLMKKPHIRTKTAGYEDLKDGCIGIEVGDSDALCRELEDFVDGKDYTELLENGYKILNEKCTVKSMTDHIVKIYREAIQIKKKK